MLFAYGGTAIGAGAMVLFLLALSSLLLAMLAGGLAHAFIENPSGFVKRLPSGIGFVAFLSVIPILLAIYINPELLTNSNSRSMSLKFLTLALLVGCVVGVIVRILKLRK